VRERRIWTSWRKEKREAVKPIQIRRKKRKEKEGGAR